MSQEESALDVERSWLITNHIIIPKELDVKRLKITQMYLVSEHIEWLSQAQHNDESIEYFHTTKKRGREVEKTITPEEFNKYMSRLCSERQAIIKTRTIFEYHNLKYELDQFFHPVLFSILVVEVNKIDQEVPLPSWLGESVEITNKKSFSNQRISKSPDAAIKKADKLIAAHRESSKS